MSDCNETITVVSVVSESDCGKECKDLLAQQHAWIGIVIIYNAQSHDRAIPVGLKVLYTVAPISNTLYRLC